MVNPISPKEYVNRLTTLNSTLRPIAKYVNATTAILHSCSVCSKETTLTPTKALSRPLKSCCWCFPITVKHFKVWLSANLSQLTYVSAPINRLESPVNLRCGKCDGRFTRTVSKVMRCANPCPHCGRESQKRSASLAIKAAWQRGDFKSILTHTDSSYKKALKGRGITPLQPYTSMDTSMRHKCLVCSHVFCNSPGNMLGGNGCRKCAGLMKKTPDEYITQLISLDSMFRPDEDYVHALHKISHSCTSCGVVRVSTPDNMLRNLRVRTCSVCVPGNKRGISKPYSLNGITYSVSGYEPLALNWLLQNTKITQDMIAVDRGGNVPKIPYRYKGHTHNHKPDMYIKRTNTLIEVKSTATLGLVPSIPRYYGADVFYRVCAKAKSAIALGFKYRLLLMSANGKRISIPDNWYGLGYREMKSILLSTSVT